MNLMKRLMPNNQSKVISDKLLLNGNPMVVVEKGNTRTLRSANGRWGYTKISINENDGHQPIYRKMQEFLDSVADKHRFRDVLVLGAGGCAIPRYFIKRHNSKVTAVEISKEVIEVAKKYFYADTYGESLTLVEDDALHYVAVTEKKYDVIFVDLFKGQGVVEEVFDKTFLANIKRIINKNGIILFNLFCSEDKCIETLMSCFPSYECITIEGPNYEKELTFISTITTNT